TARALIDVHGEEMILRDGDEGLTLNMKHDTASYSIHPRRELVNLINIFNISSEDCLEDLVSNKQSGNPTFSLHKEIASSEVIHEFHDSKGCNFLSEELPDIDSFNDIHPHFDDDPLSGSTTFSLHKEIASPEVIPEFYDSKGCTLLSEELPDIDSFNDIHPYFDDEPLNPLDLPCDILYEYDSFNSQDFSRDDVLSSPDNEDKVFNPGILSHEIITRVTQEKKLAVCFASGLFEDVFMFSKSI
nr:hypothetical protein [Tanacetum cinerariifolium]